MRVYNHRTGIILVGKAREIRTALRAYALRYQTVKDWLESESKKFS
jgi:hypothetical protein